MDEDTDILDPEVDEDEDDDQIVPAVEGDTVPREQYEKAVKAERSLRTRLRRTEMESEYGKDVVELVPTTLPLKEQKALAAKLKERLGSQAATTPADESADASTETPEVEPTEQERRAAALVQQGSGSTSSGPMSAAEWRDVAKKDPALGQQLLETGRVDLAGLREGLGPDR